MDIEYWVLCFCLYACDPSIFYILRVFKSECLRLVIRKSKETGHPLHHCPVSCRTGSASGSNAKAGNSIVHRCFATMLNLFSHSDSKMTWPTLHIFFLKISTTLGTNKVPENMASQKGTSLPTAHFQVLCCSFREGVYSICLVMPNWLLLVPYCFHICSRQLCQGKVGAGEKQPKSATGAEIPRSSW